MQRFDQDDVIREGREIAAAVAALQIEDAQGGPTSLSGGGRIATGEAFVGNIQAADRMIWSVIGSTTNLAARLQVLTRNLDAAVVIDAAIREALGATGGDFEKREGTPIRGRQQVQDLYVLPLSGEAP